MPFARQTLLQIRDQAIADIESAELTGADGTRLVRVLDRAIIRVLAYMVAGSSHEHYGYIDWIARESVPWSSTDERLEGWGLLKGIARKTGGYAEAHVTFDAATASTIPADTQITRTDGVVYRVTAPATESAGSIVASAVCLTIGTAGNFADGVLFTLSSAVSGVDPQSVDSTVVTPGADLETMDEYRARVLAEYAAPPHGGDMADYIEWATAFAPVTRAWIGPHLAGIGSVTVFFMEDDARAAFDGFPQGTDGTAAEEDRGTAVATGDQLALANYLYPLRPVTALVYANAPTALPVDFTIDDLGTKNTAENQAAITAALTDMFLRLGEVGGSVDPASGSPWPSIEPAAWYIALASIPTLGGSFSVSVPSAPISPGVAELPVLGTVTFNT